jgi:hypothetical protein
MIGADRDSVEFHFVSLKSGDVLPARGPTFSAFSQRWADLGPSCSCFENIFASGRDDGSVPIALTHPRQPLHEQRMQGRGDGLRSLRVDPRAITGPLGIVPTSGRSPAQESQGAKLRWGNHRRCLLQGVWLVLVGKTREVVIENSL